MGARHLMDSNAIIDYLAAEFPPNGLLVLDEILSSDANISAIAQIELLSFTPTQKSVAHKIEQFVSQANMFPIDEHIVALTILLRKKHKIKLPEAIIAATAISEDLILITNNEKDFSKIKGLKILNPHKL